jgi:GntR family transcriptional regulator/MocR family aminotransferase
MLINRKSPVPIYQQLANGFIKLIREGILKPGYPLPASRTFARLMMINRSTVIATYEELRFQDWVDTIPKKGVFISKQLPILIPVKFENSTEINSYTKKSFPGYFLKFALKGPLPSPTKAYNLIINDGYPDSRIAPLSALINQYKSLMGKPYMDSFFMKGQNGGAKNLRGELASFISKTRAMDIDEENVLVTRGAQSAIYIAARMLLSAGGKVIVADPNYNFANAIFEQFGATLLRVKVDGQGIDVDEIEKICKTGHPDLLYIIPHHHHPTTVTLNAERRIKLLNIIHNYHLPVIEDDYDYDFHYNNRPILPLASADQTGCVIYIGSITKTLTPTIRSGYLIAGKEFILHASRLKEIMELRGDVLMESSLASLYGTGEMEKHINKSVKLYKTRRDIFCDLLTTKLGDMLHFSKPLGGMAIWTTFNDKYSLASISKKIARDGIYMNDGSLYNSQGIEGNSLRLGFASMNESEMHVFIQALRRFK